MYLDNIRPLGCQKLSQASLRQNLTKMWQLLPVKPWIQIVTLLIPPLYDRVPLRRNLLSSEMTVNDFCVIYRSSLNKIFWLYRYQYIISFATTSLNNAEWQFTFMSRICSRLCVRICSSMVLSIFCNNGIFRNFTIYWYIKIWNMSFWFLEKYV